MKIIKYILAILVCFALLNGCVRGTLNKPLLIPSTPSIDNEKATVKFYRSSDSFGLLSLDINSFQTISRSTIRFLKKALKRILFILLGSNCTE